MQRKDKRKIMIEEGLENDDDGEAADIDGASQSTKQLINTEE